MKPAGLTVTAVLLVLAGFVGGVLGGLLVSSDPVGAERPPLLTRVVTAEEFRVVDEQGRVVASLGTEPSLLSRLNLYDRDGNLRAALSVSAIHESVGLSLYSKRRDSQSLRVQTRPDGLSSLTFFDERGAPSAALGTIYAQPKPEGDPVRPSLRFFDPSGARTVVWQAP